MSAAAIDQTSPAEVTVSDGGQSYRICLPHHETDYIQKKLFDTRIPYEVDMLRDMADRLSPGDLVIDVGANIGNHSLYLAAVCGCKVVAFEPNIDLAQALEQSVALNGLEKMVRVQAKGVGAQAGTARFGDLRPDNLGAQSLVPGEGEIPLVSLDKARLAKGIRMIKVDVEGMEPEVLQGARQIITRDRPILYVESATEGNFREIQRLLRQMDYLLWDTFNATPTHLFLPAETVTPEQHLDFIKTREVLGSLRKKSDADALRRQLNEANLKHRTVSQQLTEARALQAEARNRQAELEAASREQADAFAALAEERSTLSTALEEARAKYRIVSQQVAEARGALAQAQAQVQELQSAAKAQGAALAAVTAERDGAQAALDQAQAEVARLMAEREAQDAALSVLASEKAEVLDALEKVRATHNALEQQLAGTRATLTEAQAQIERQAMGLSARDEQVAALDAARIGLSAMLDEVRWDAAQATRRHAEVEARLRHERERADRAEAEADALRGKAARQLRGQESQPALRSQTAALTPDIVAAWATALSLPPDQMAERWLCLAGRLMPVYPDQARALMHVVAGLGPNPASDRAARQLGFMLIEDGEGPQALALLNPLADRLNLSSREARMLALARTGETGNALRDKARRAVRSRLRVATIMDEFTALGYGPECDLQQLSVANWEQELADFQPDLLLIESAWRGLNEEWGPKVGHVSTEVQGVLRWCEAHGVPKAFWNKEDPVHFETFLNVAQKFDLVFTTDIDCVPRYKAALGHDRVHLLPFACQPEVHNPVEREPRKAAFCFAGAYYVRYPDRTRDLDDMLEHLTTHLPFEIFDRNFGKDHPDYMFPEDYRKYIVGTLAPSEIDRAYKGYEFGINLNSVKNSQSMYARRVYELMASNTRVVSNYSPGLRKMFGDLVIATDSGAEALRRIRLQDDRGLAPRVRLAALRKALAEHTYSHRIARIARLAGLDVPDPSALPKVTVLARAETRAEADGILAQVSRQHLEGTRLVIVLAQGVDLTGIDLPDTVTCLHANQAKAMRLADLAAPGGWVAGFVAGDYYGPNYLTDLILATRYSDDRVIGKAAHHLMADDGTLTLATGPAYTPVAELCLRRSILRHDALPDTDLLTWLQALPEAVAEGDGLLALDPFSYCQDGAGDPAHVASRVDDLPDLRTGIPEPELEAIADALPAAPSETIDPAGIIPGSVLAADMPLPASGKITWTVAENGEWTISSQLGPEEHQYIYEMKGRPLHDIAAQGGPFPVHAHVGVGLNILFVAVWQNEKREKIDHQIFAANQNITLTPPPGTAFVRFGIRPRGPGACTLRGIQLSEHFPPPRPVIGGGRVLLLTNHYPSYADLYRNGFVHSRVRAYREMGGITPDIYRLRPDQDLTWHEFQNIDCMTGSAEQLDFLLASGRYDHVLVHFLDPEMWAVLRRHIDRVRVTVWVHGAEVQPWWRRSFNYTTDQELAKAKEVSDQRLAFWRGVFNPLPANLHLVFVSKYFADEVFEDLEVTCPPDQVSIIHNPIDDQLFAYHEKPVEQRGKILSIRPFASAKYANDLSVKAILALQRRDFFDQLEFRIIGDGPLFDEVTAPLAGIPNVILEKRFLAQQEIAEIQRDYGVFLNPTRWDSHGVSRDEAMSAGLVPVTSRNSAIPEFVDDRCGYLAETEDAEGLARAIVEMWKNPDIFAAKSKAAAERVRTQRGKERVIAMELGLIEDWKGQNNK